MENPVDDGKNNNAKQNNNNNNNTNKKLSLAITRSSFINVNVRHDTFCILFAKVSL